MVVPAFVAMSRPWLVAWSLSTLIDAPDTPAQQAAAEELSLLMRFRAAHFDALFDFAGAGDTHANDHAARVGVLTSWRNNAVLQPANASGSGKLQVRPPAKSLRALGVDYRFETAKTIGFGSLSGEHTSLEMLLCDDDVSLDAATAAAIGVWVRGGGSLWATQRCATVDELGRPHDQPLLHADIEKHGSGKGSAHWLPSGASLQTSAEWVQAALKMSQITEPRTPDHPKTTSWQSTSWHSPQRGTLVTHFENVSDTGGSTLWSDLVLRLALPPSMARRQSALTATLLTPYEGADRTLPLEQTDSAAVSVRVIAPPKYGALVIKTTDEAAPIYTNAGTFDKFWGETTPLVFHNELVRMETRYSRPYSGPFASEARIDATDLEPGHLRIRRVRDRKVLVDPIPSSLGLRYGSGYVDRANGRETLYAFGSAFCDVPSLAKCQHGSTHSPACTFRSVGPV